MNYLEVRERVANDTAGLMIELLNRIEALEKQVADLKHNKADKRKKKVTNGPK